MSVVRLIVPAALIAAAVPAAGAPRIVVPEATWNAGVVAKGDVVRHAFTVRNDGVTDLHVTEVRPSCGCAAAEFDRVVGPGREGRITLAIDTKGFQGPVSKSAVVLTDDPVSPQTTLLVSVTVKPVVEVLPGGFLRLQGIAGEKTSAQVLVVSDEPGFSPANAVAPQPWMTADVSPVPEKERLANRGPRQFRVRVTVGADAPEGLLGGALKIPTGIERLPVLEVPLSGFLRPTVAVNTGRISFQNFVPEGEPVRRTVLLTNYNPRNERFAVTAADVSVAGITAEVVPIDRQKVQVVLTVDPRMPKGSFEGTLTVRTNDPVKGEIRLPLSGTVLQRAGGSSTKG